MTSESMETARAELGANLADVALNDPACGAGGGGASVKGTGFKRRLAGRVKSNKMMKTVVVQVVRYYRHPVYKKYVRTRTSYKAHDENNSCQVGDRVEIMESRPMSREKRWKVVRVLERAVID